MRSYNINSKAACYLRLSREDGDKIESDSISNQRELISDFVKSQEGIRLVKEYVDDGYSGTNFERPAFKEMMNDVREGRIDCIIVKDLSRLGRNYIETGRYLERIFPFLDVRFISILDHYDSAGEDNDADQIIIPFKNLLNDSYCRDISIKIQSQFDIKRKAGKFIGSFASYGYAKDPADKNHLIIDPFAAEIVRQIFQMRIEGYSAYRIADTLNEMGVLPPADYKRSIGLNYDTGYKTSAHSVWYASTVLRILTNEMYTGTMVQGITRKINYKIKQSRRVPKKDWIRVKGTHEAIVTEEAFQAVQNLMLMDTRTAPGEEAVHVLSGLVVCGDCGQSMIRRITRKKNKQYYYYHCSTYKNGLGCTSHLINAEKLEGIVLDALRLQIRLLIKAEDIVSEIDKIPMQHSGMKMINGQLEELEKEIERYSNFKAKAYSDMLAGEITQEDYHTYNRSFTVRLDRAKQKKAELIESRDNILLNEKKLKPWIQQLRDYQDIDHLTRTIVVSLIDRIIIYDKENVEVRMKHADELEVLMTMAKKAEAEREEMLCAL